MRNLVFGAAALACCAAVGAQEAPWALAIHGGAGVMARGAMDPPTESAFRQSLAAALDSGAAILAGGGTALDAVETATRILEDDPRFNAGRGAVFTAAGTVEHDASIMDGATLAAGASAGTTTVRNPVTLARAIMERSRHVMLQGRGAEAFATEQGLELVEPVWFFTEPRWQALERALRAEGLPMPMRPAGAPLPDAALPNAAPDGHFGTVGAVALDMAGNLAAATSTGGLTAKRWGRVGDSPIIGAGTFASNASCAVSATGSGEHFIRLAIAHRICSLVELGGLPVQEAADRVIQHELTRLGGDGGVITLSPDGTVAWSFNTLGMYRAKVSSRTAPVVAIYADEP